MTKEAHQHRKDAHLSLAVKFAREKELSKTLPPKPFDGVRLIPKTLPELATADVDTSVRLFDHVFDWPFYIEAMTGGTPRGDAVNAQLAAIARDTGLAMAVGSQSVALAYPELAPGFAKLRQINPDGFLIANLGAAHSLDDARRAVDMMGANALELHVNAMQELAMADGEGDRSFYWLEHIHELATKLAVPVIVKEVGFGMSAAAVSQLTDTAVAAINVGGRGGTDFAQIEAARGGRQLLTDYGFTTAESLLAAVAVNPTKPLIATGGLSTAEDIAKSLILGATLTSSAGKILSTLTEHGVEATEQLVSTWRDDLVKIMTLLGATDVTALRTAPRLLSPALTDFVRAIKTV